jgi:Chaperone of endosialidase
MSQKEGITMKRVKNGLVLVISLFSFLCLMSAAGAVSGDAPVAGVTAGPDRIVWEPKVENANLALTVAGPEEAVFQKTFGAGIKPSFELLDNHGNRFGDGSCNYELKQMPELEPELRRVLAAARESGDGSVVNELKRAGKLPETGSVQSGVFWIRDGVIVMGDESAAATPGGRDPAGEGVVLPMDQIIHDDLIVTGSICVGFDCVAGESFGQDTILLKEHNLGIHFQDTSAGVSFPTNDWRISINSSSEGGANSFAVTDMDGGVTPFKILAQAPDNSLYVDNRGRLGLGTSTPGARLHMTHGDSPFVRLEQDGSYGMEPQIWDIGGNEAYFGVRDATGADIPFRIEAGSPTNTLNLKSDGKVGIGTWTPTAPLTLVTTEQDASIVADRTDGAAALVSGSADYALLGATTSHAVRFVSENEWMMELNPQASLPTRGLGNSLQMRNGAACTAAGVWVNSSSREVKNHIRDLSSTVAMKALEELKPVRFFYNGDDRDEYVGFIAEEVPDLVATNGRKGMSPMDVVAVLTKVVQEQQKTIDEMSGRMADLERRLNEKEPLKVAVIPLSGQHFR